jgi:hypothetical protein
MAMIIKFIQVYDAVRYDLRLIDVLDELNVSIFAYPEDIKDILSLQMYA